MRKEEKRREKEKRRRKEKKKREEEGRRREEGKRETREREETEASRLLSRDSVREGGERRGVKEKGVRRVEGT